MSLDSGLVDALRRLDAAGATESGTFGTWPTNRKEAARVALEAREWAHRLPGTLEDDRALLMAELVDETEGRLRGTGMQYLRFRAAKHEEGFRSWNEFGRDDADGVRVTSKAVVNVGEAAVVTLRAEVERDDDVSDGGAPEFRFLEANVRAFLGSWEFEYGTDSLWWGPGAHGSILMSSNARPFEQLFKVSTHEPVLLPFLGWPTYCALFWTKLEEDRARPEPYLAGMRLEFRIRPNVALGVSRTAMFGGEGRPAVDLGVVWDVFWARAENVPDEQPGDQRAGVDIAVRLPSDRQPVQLYFEVAGEDEAGSMPTKRAWLAGVYLPRLGPVSKLEARLEWATTRTDLDGSPLGDVWYSHSLYGDGYTYYGRIMGHHMGPNADDCFLSVGWRPREDLRFTAFFDWERRGSLSGPAETKREFGLDFYWRVAEKRALGGSVAIQGFSDFEHVEGENRETGRVQAWIEFLF